MATKYVIDAHTIIWFVAGSPRLGSNAKTIIVDMQNRLYLPVIALAEACHIVVRGKTSVSSVEALLQAIDADPRITVVPLDRTILDRSLTIPAITEMHDRLIVATTLCVADMGEPVVLLTCDENITDSGLVPVIW